MRQHYPIPRYVSEFGDTELPLHSAKILPSMSNPVHVPVKEVDYVREDDIVMGLVYKGLSRCYPGWIMDNYHIVNDAFEGAHLLVVY